MSNDVISSPSPSSLIGGKYELLGLIGRGGMGSVYEGRHASLGTAVAIKFIDLEYANSQDARSRFDTEARAAATIQSKHAIQIYDHGVTEDGRPYIVMELLLGESLDARLKRSGTIPLDETARIVRQVARALTRAHERGIVHRDLKPENIFLVRGPDDDEDVAKVLDFGIAKIKTTPGAVGISSSTKTGTLLGTPFFMSPEQARGLRSVDHRTDLWSLGVIVFKCVTGVLPFDGESLGDLLVKICTAPFSLPSRTVPEHLPPLPREVDAWMLRALDREPEQRFQTANDLADSLGALAGLSFRRGTASTPEPSLAGGSPGVISSSNPAFTPGSGRAGPIPSSSGARNVARQPSAPSFGAQSFSEPIPAATSAPLTAPAPSSARPSSKVGIAVAAAFGLLLGVAIILFRFGATKTPPASGIAIGAAPPPAVSATQSPPPPPSQSPSATPNTGVATPPTPANDSTAAMVATPHPGPGTKPAAIKPGQKPKTTTPVPVAAQGATLPAAGPGPASPPPPGGYPPDPRAAGQPAPPPKPNAPANPGGPATGDPGY